MSQWSLTHWGSLIFSPRASACEIECIFSDGHSSAAPRFFRLFWRLINEPFEKCTFECVLGATVSTVCVQPGFSHQIFRSSNQQAPLRLFLFYIFIYVYMGFFFYLVFILKPDCRSIRLANRHANIGQCTRSDNIREHLMELEQSYFNSSYSS